jgi:hypothetical protein
MSFWRLACLAVPAAIVVAGCSSSNDIHSFWAAHYSSSNDCLETMSVTDVLNGPDPGRCAKIVCWLNPHTNDAFISETMCDGPPGWRSYDSIGSGTLCDLALAARARSNSGACSAADSGTD